MSTWLVFVSPNLNVYGTSLISWICSAFKTSLISYWSKHVDFLEGQLYLSVAGWPGNISHNCSPSFSALQKLSSALWSVSNVSVFKACISRLSTSRPPCMSNMSWRKNLWLTLCLGWYSFLMALQFLVQNDLVYTTTNYRKLFIEESTWSRIRISAMFQPFICLLQFEYFVSLWGILYWNLDIRF